MSLDDISQIGNILGNCYAFAGFHLGGKWNLFANMHTMLTLFVKSPPPQISFKFTFRSPPR